jgi:hypothetical protein
VTPAWIIAVVGAGAANLVPGGVNVALAGTSDAGAEARWHVSQVVLEGMCDPAPWEALDGITTIFETP